MKRSKASLKTTIIVSAAAIVLSACAASPGYDSTTLGFDDGYPDYAQPPYGYMPYGYLDFDYWGGHQGWRHDHDWDRHGGRR